MSDSTSQLPGAALYNAAVQLEEQIKCDIESRFDQFESTMGIRPSGLEVEFTDITNIEHGSKIGIERTRCKKVIVSLPDMYD